MLFFLQSVPAANGGRACAYNAGDNITAECTGPVQCGECQQCNITACVNKAAGTACASNLLVSLHWVWPASFTVFPLALSYYDSRAMSDVSLLLVASLELCIKL